jgi:aspartate kinase
MQLIVQKYGGATLSDPEKIKFIAKRIFELHKSGVKIVAVVSAMGQTTNQLIALAHQVSPRPSLRELDMLLTTGERMSMSLLSMALNDLGAAAISFTGSQAGILTDDAHVNANIIDVKAFRVEEALQQNKIVILAGFQGVSHKTKEITTLGRGGSDISAVAMASYLKADRCEILKDVSCVYSADPKLVENSIPLTDMTYTHLLEMTLWGAQVLHHRSVKLAADKNVTLFIGSAADKTSKGTLVTADHQFKNQKILAINSFNQVLALRTKNSFDSFQEFLHESQISPTQLLCKNSDLFYITAPAEVLKDIQAFEVEQNYFKIMNSDLAAVSATFTHEVSPADLENTKAILQKNNIQPSEAFFTKYSLHFLVSKNQKNATVQVLHALIDS